ncbi:MAG: hypothetical protein ABEJ03_01765 [Candidatus Nanohaloarchaea archaeon]
MEEAMTFSELRKIQKNEEREEKLTELGDNFMLKAGSYFDQKREHGNDREFRNAERVFDKIISLREDKIVRSAKIATKSSSSAPENLLPFENELFRDLKEAFAGHRDRKEERKEEGSSGEVQMAESGKTEDEPKETEESGESPEEGYEIIEITSDVPEFMGTDLESYGPLEEGETVEVPEENADILVNRGNAELVE